MMTINDKNELNSIELKTRKKMLREPASLTRGTNYGCYVKFGSWWHHVTVIMSWKLEFHFFYLTDYSSYRTGSEIRILKVKCLMFYIKYFLPRCFWSNGVATAGVFNFLISSNIKKEWMMMIPKYDDPLWATPFQHTLIAVHNYFTF